MRSFRIGKLQINLRLVVFVFRRGRDPDYHFLKRHALLHRRGPGGKSEGVGLPAQKLIVLLPDLNVNFFRALYKIPGDRVAAHALVQRAIPGIDLAARWSATKKVLIEALEPGAVVTALLLEKLLRGQEHARNLLGAQPAIIHDLQPVVQSAGLGGAGQEGLVIASQGAGTKFGAVDKAARNGCRAGAVIDRVGPPGNLQTGRLMAQHVVVKSGYQPRRVRAAYRLRRRTGRRGAP